jgi:hypothetical protein
MDVNDMDMGIAAIFSQRNANQIMPCVSAPIEA